MCIRDGPVHDAARRASGLFTLLALAFILLAARELHGRDHAAAGPLILAGSIGFLFHAHEAQPMLAALTANTAAFCAVSYTHLRAHETVLALVCRLLLEKKQRNKKKKTHKQKALPNTLTPQ